MSRSFLQRWGLLGAALLCLLLYVFFAPREQTEPSENVRLSQTVENPAENPEKKPEGLPAAGERVAIRGHGILLREAPGLNAEVVHESEPGESFYTTGAHAEADELVWLEIEVSPGQKAWISKGFIQPLNTAKDPNAADDPNIADKAISTQASAPAMEPAPETAIENIEDPHLKTAPYWARLAPEVRKDISIKLTMALLKKSNTLYTADHAIALAACLDASSKSPDLQTLKIYELASTCALAMGWI